MRGNYKSRDDDEDKDEDIRWRLHDMDLYDQGLLELKKLANEKKAASSDRRKVYDIAIEKTIRDIFELSESVIPAKIVRSDIEIALQGGKYRDLYHDPDDFDDVIRIRRKKRSKPKVKKPVRKIIKKKRK